MTRFLSLPVRGASTKIVDTSPSLTCTAVSKISFCGQTQ